MAEFDVWSEVSINCKNRKNKTKLLSVRKRMFSSKALKPSHPFIVYKIIHLLIKPLISHFEPH